MTKEEFEQQLDELLLKASEGFENEEESLAGNVAELIDWWQQFGRLVVMATITRYDEFVEANGLVYSPKERLQNIRTHVENIRNEMAYFVNMYALLDKQQRKSNRMTEAEENAVNEYMQKTFGIDPEKPVQRIVIDNRKSAEGSDDVLFQTLADDNPLVGGVDTFVPSAPGVDTSKPSAVSEGAGVADNPDIPAGF